MFRVADKVGINRRDASKIIEQVHSAVAKWPSFASKAGVTKKSAKEIELRLRHS
jgi:hypothetical protein